MNFTRSIRNLLVAGAMAGAMLAIPAARAQVAVGIEAGVAPPPIPDYEQPVIPGDGYIWTPGYWAWGPAGYYWVDGAWVYPPYVGALWTPGWWGWGGGGYFWHAGYWGRNVGYYGGINYGFGYFGIGFYGGYWNGGRFFYNRAYGHFGPGFRGAFYNRTYAGFSGRPGGASFNAHPAAQYAGFHGGAAAGRSTINGSYHGSTQGAANRGYAAAHTSGGYSAHTSGGGGYHGGGGGAHAGGGGHSGGRR